MMSRVIWLGAELEELASAIKERCAGGRKENVAPMGCEDIGLAVTTGRRNDDFELRHECYLSPKRWRRRADNFESPSMVFTPSTDRSAALSLLIRAFEPAPKPTLWYRRLISARWQWRRRDRQIIH